MAVTFLPREQAVLQDLSSTPTLELPGAVHRALAAARGSSYYWKQPASLARFVFDVAATLQSRGVRGEALPLFREALAGLTATQGWEHESTCLAAAHLMKCRAELGMKAMDVLI